MKFLVYCFVLSLTRLECNEIGSEEDLPTVCHVCKHTVDEFLNELSASNSKDILKLGHVLQSEERQKTIVYKKSELRLIEALENTCKNLKDYKVHKDKESYFRYSKEESGTFKTLNQLRDRGVKVDLGFPDEMWDAPDAEVVKLKTQCENLLEQYEEDISEWYYNHQGENLDNWLCVDRVLKERKTKDCLEDFTQNTKNKKVVDKMETPSGKDAKESERKTLSNNEEGKTNKKGNNFKREFRTKVNVDKLSKRDEL